MIDDIRYERYKPREEALKIIAESRRFAEKPVTVRQIFYQLVSRCMLKNAKDRYRKLDRILVRARKAGFIPFEWIEDRSRNSLILPLYPSISNYIEEMIEHYWKDTWKNQP